MTEDISKIKKVSPETRSAVARKSAQTLPNRPSEQGYSAEEIKRRFYQPILDAANSALAEIDRIAEEANLVFSQVDGKLNGFIDNSQLKAPYKKDLDNGTWAFNDFSGRYEFLITKAVHGVEDFKDISVEMYLLDGEGKLARVNNYDIFTSGDVRLYNENLGGGFVSISQNRDGFVRGDIITDVDHIVGIADVAKTNDYNDLNNKPNIEQIAQNEEMISKIIQGTQVVNKALNAVNATEAQYAASAGNASNAVNAQSANRAIADGNGANIVGSYAKQSGEYSNLSVGKATLSEKAKADEDNINFKENYAKQKGKYPDMTVGNVDISNVGKLLHPIGSIMFSANNVNPSTYIIGTTWVAWGSGRVPVGINASDTDFNTTEKTGGDKNAIIVSHVHTMGSAGLHGHGITDNGHRHGIPDEIGTSVHSNRGIKAENCDDLNDDRWTNTSTTGISINSGGSHAHTINSTGDSGANKNLQPYIVCYMWKRTE